jgi:hypothetical protein
MLVLFIVLVPVLVLYATGYRFNILDVRETFRVVGGLYISTDIPDANIVLNNEPVEDIRIFQSAAYIQNVPEGVHEIYVDAPGVVTWVKELPVFAHLVTEARSFNVPTVPQVRVITPWIHATSGATVLFEPLSDTPFAEASTTASFFVATSTATTSFVANTEYTYITTLFGTSTIENDRGIRDQLPRLSLDRGATTTDTVVLTEEIATTTKIYNNAKLFESDGEVYVSWLGEQRSTPFYYCLNYQGASSTAELYGTHVYTQLYTQLASTTDLVSDVHHDTLLCRHTIRIDRGFSDVSWFDFVPGSRDLVLMLLADGLYVVEVDDRAWQNMQLLYPGTNVTVRVEDSNIFIKDGEYFLEVETELPS